MAQIWGKRAHLTHKAAFLNAQPLTHSQLVYTLPLEQNTEMFMPLTTFQTKLEKTAISLYNNTRTMSFDSKYAKQPRLYPAGLGVVR
jgi:hypothetical protein